MDYRAMARALEAKALRQIRAADRDRLLLLSEAAKILATHEYFARRAQHYEQMAQSFLGESPQRADLLMLAHRMRERSNRLVRLSDSTPENSPAL
jgi:hypothetical protein